jgi:hypothetical protein
MSERHIKLILLHLTKDAGVNMACTFATHFHVYWLLQYSIHCECPKTMRDPALQQGRHWRSSKTVAAEICAQ